MLQFHLSCVSKSRKRRTDSIDGLNYATYIMKWDAYALLPASLAVTKGILVSFYYYAAPTNMFKFSAYPRSSWGAFSSVCVCIDSLTQCYATHVHWEVKWLVHEAANALVQRIKLIWLILAIANVVGSWRAMKYLPVHVYRVYNYWSVLTPRIIYET